MPLSPLQERISELCSRVVSTSDPQGFEQAMVELRTELRSQLSYLKRMVDDAKQTISYIPRQSVLDRRKSDRRKIDRRGKQLASVA